jgi:hypothetical protein
MKITINNTFHNTSKNVRLFPGRNEIRGRRLREWKRELCCAGCTCSGLGGLRGDVDNGTHAIEGPDGHALEFENAHNPRTGEEYLVIWVD